MPCIRHRTFLILHLLPCLFVPILCAANYKATSKLHIGNDVKEVTNSLLSFREDPLAREDKWSAVSDSLREAWTSAHETVRISDGIEQVLEHTKHLRETGISLHVDIQIVAPENFISTHHLSLLNHYASAMKSGRNGTSLLFDVSLAPTSLYSRVAMHSPSQHPNDLMGILEQTAATLGHMNVMFVILNHGQDPISHFASKMPFLGHSRTSWFLYTIEKGRTLNVADLLTATERAAERIYAPAPLYFPLPSIPTLQVDVTAFTPGYDRRALWLDHFSWGLFERSLRNVAVFGQKLTFFSSQINADCPLCPEVFRNVESFSSQFATRAAAMLSGGNIPNHDWSYGVTSTKADKKVPRDTIRLYVLDTVKLHKTESLQRLEKRPLSLFPGMAILTFRSSDRDKVYNLNSYLVQAFLAAAYGVAEPEMYLPLQRAGDKVEVSGRPSAVLLDIVYRNLVRSVVEKRIYELEEIVQGILYFDVDPAKSLGEREFVYLSQRINLMLFKLERAQRILGDLNDHSAALFLALSAHHDMKAIRSAFDLYPGTKSFERFRDPTLRCHFSRLKREALRASELIEATYPVFRPLIFACIRFIGMAILTAFLLHLRTNMKSRGKRE